MTSELNALAELAYNAYADQVGWKNVMGLPMPSWDDLPTKIRAAWIAAVHAVRDSVKSSM